MTYDDDLGGRKDDAGKLRHTLLSATAVDEVLRVLEFGASKYGAGNWKQVDNMHTRYMNAALRHVASYREGHVLDKETGLNHLAHAICCLVFILDIDLLIQKNG